MVMMPPTLARHAPRDIVYGPSNSSEYAQLGQAPSQTFRSFNGKPPIPNIRTAPSDPSLLQDGYIFLGINNRLGQSGPLIFDNTGSLIYFAPDYDRTMHFRPQVYQGKPVLTFFDGSFFSSGYGNGTNLIMDDQYNIIGNISWCVPSPARVVLPVLTCFDLAQISRPTRAISTKFRSRLKALGWSSPGDSRRPI
jgi:hypothetical protein